MKLYYVVYEQTITLVGVFDTLFECFNWKPDVPLQAPVLIKEVKRYDDGTFQIHTIHTSELHWSLADEKLKLNPS
jgi:hypothetical protein